MASGKGRLAAIAALATIAGLGRCGNGASAPAPVAADPPAVASSRAPQAEPGTYFEQWPDVYGAPAPEGARERFPEGQPVAPPAGPESQRPLRTLQSR
ncbi:MAG: hypothetical protein IT372_32490 [Polyangiaceae bacterium]|nr:hypothetical protein [Polyangiaceae bacterium]